MRNYTIFESTKPAASSPPPPAPPPGAQVGDVAGVVALLAGAKARGLQYPKLWLQLPDGSPLRVTVAGAQSRTPGFLMLTDGQPFGSSRFYGRVSPAGQFECGRQQSAAVSASVADLLKRLALDPAGVASEYGHLTGNCTFCGLKLTDERSVKVGYGQKCAQRFGLPWGHK